MNLFNTPIDILLSNYYTTPVLCCYIATSFIYLALVYIYKTFIYSPNKYITNSNTLKYSLFIWNLIASLTSCIFFYWSFKELMMEVVYRGLCITDFEKLYVPGIFLYIITKPLEFIDTIFLMLNNKQIIFLHWYHHFLTLLVTVYLALNPYKHSYIGYYFAFINTFIHGIMYGYYAITCFTNPLSIFLRKYAWLITILQIIQMFIGIILIIASLSCYNAFNNKLELFITFGMYTSYVILFLQMYLKKNNLKKVK